MPDTQQWVCKQSIILLLTETAVPIIKPGLLALCVVLVTAFASVALAAPCPDEANGVLGVEIPPTPSRTFSKAFDPSTIGLGSTITLTFMIDKRCGTVLVNNLACMDNLPAGIKITNPAKAWTDDCTNATLSAPANAGTITLSGVGVGIGETYTITDGHCGCNELSRV